jgi:hypothetical protein
MSFAAFTHSVKHFVFPVPMMVPIAHAMVCRAMHGTGIAFAAFLAVNALEDLAVV